jgi:hypothetical protein
VYHSQASLQAAASTAAILSSTVSPASDASLISVSNIDDYLSQFWNLYLPTGYRDDVLPAAPWAHVHASQELALRDPLLKTALLACAFMCLGRARSDNRLITQGRLNYAKALTGVHQALQDQDKALSDNTLACCRALGLFEFFRNSDDDEVSSRAGDWTRHIRGLCRICELRGPSDELSDHGKELYESIRFSATIVDVTYRRTKLCAAPMWRSQTDEVPDRALGQSLLEIVAAAPRILIDADTLLQTAQQASPLDGSLATIYRECVAVLDRYKDIATSLGEWETAALAAVDAFSPTYIEASPSLVNICRSHGYGFFHLCHFFWAISTTLFENAASLHQHITTILNQLSSGTLTLPPQPSQINAAPLATNIARTASHFFDPAAGFWGPQSAAFSMGTAIRYFALTNQQEQHNRDGTLTDFGEIVRLLRQSASSMMTREFLRSISSDVSSTTGDDEEGSSEAGSGRVSGGGWFDNDRM